jgi:hypothetical protein
MAFTDYVVYVDESGDHALDRVDADFPVFTLLCCIFRKSDYLSAVVPSVQRFKFKWFGHDTVILHGSDIRKVKPPFTFLRAKELREEFVDELSEIIADAPVTVIAAVIDKAAHVRSYSTPDDPYGIALLFCLERVFAFLRDHGDHHKTTHCVFERRGKKEDRHLRQVFDRIVSGANSWGPLPFEGIFADKLCNSSGLQLADLMAHPVSRSVIAPKAQNRAYDLIKGKLRRSAFGVVRGYGLKVFP